MESRSKKQGLVWGGLLILFGALSLLQLYVELTVWLWVVVFAAAGLGAFVIYLTDPADWGLLIPPYVLWALALLLALIETDILQDDWIALFTLSAVALPFLVGFLRNRENWGLLIPAYVLLSIGLMVVLVDDDLIPAYVMFVIAIPFFVVYLRNRANWWALIPAGIMSVIGVSFLISEMALEYVLPIAAILAGLGILLRQFLGKAHDLPKERDEPTSEVGDSLPR